MGFINIQTQFTKITPSASGCDPYWILGTTPQYISWYAMDTDSSGNVYVRGQYSSWPLVMKVDPSGNVLWSQRLTGTTSSLGGITVDASGDVYIIFEGTSLPPHLSSNRSIILAKIDSNGDHIWQRAYGSSSETRGSDVAVDSVGNVYLVGTVYVTDPTPANNNLLLVKFDPNGNVIWERVIGGTASSFLHETGSGIAVDINDNVVVTGRTTTPIPGRSVNQDVLIVKFDSGGNLLWQRSFGGDGSVAGNEAGQRVATDSSGAIYIVGFAETSGQTPPGNGREVLLVKYDPSGSVVWQRTLGTTTFDTGYGVSVDPNDDVYISGSIGDIYVAVVKVNSSGNVEYMRGLTEGWLIGYGMVVDSNNIYVGSDEGVLAKLPASGDETGTHGIFSYISTDLAWDVTNTNMTETITDLPFKPTTSLDVAAIENSWEAFSYNPPFTTITTCN